MVLSGGGVGGQLASRLLDGDATRAPYRYYYKGRETEDVPTVLTY
jgi:hypothetical protein